MADGLPVERLRQYLRELKPEARGLLIGELERGLLRGDATPGAELVLQELRRLAREAGRPASRGGSLSRLFFQPIEPFLVDDVATHHHPGRIARAALEPIWEWVCRDLLPGEAKAVTEDVARALSQGDTARADDLARGFQDRVALRAQEALDNAGSDERTLRRLAGQIATPRGTEDIRAIVKVLKSQDAFDEFGAHLPGHIPSLEGETLAKAKALLDIVPIEDADTLLSGLLIVMSRLASPWQLIRIATADMPGAPAAQLAESRYAATVSIVLAEIERVVSELKAELRSGRGLAVGALLKSIHDAIHGLRTEIDLPVDSPWGRQLASLRTDTANLLKGEIESMPGRVHRLLRPRSLQDIAPGSVADRGDASDCEASIAFVNTCRLYASELEIDDVTQRAWSELSDYLGGVAEPLANALRGAGDSDRAFRQSQFDAAIGFCAIVFGPERAAALAAAARADEHRKASNG
jgi:hypothetical protein